MVHPAPRGTLNEEALPETVASLPPVVATRSWPRAVFRSHAWSDAIAIAVSSHPSAASMNGVIRYAADIQAGALTAPSFSLASAACFAAPAFAWWSMTGR
jgi:hypothetical protein